MEDKGVKGWGMAGDGKEVTFALGEGVGGGKGETSGVVRLSFSLAFGKE